MSATTLFLMGAACVGPHPTLAPSIAQPNTRPARNFTSFSQALTCMDRLLGQSARGSLLISSSGFPDETRGVDVGADDMLINAINQMNRSNQKYVFLDQARISGFGQLEIVTTRKKDEVKPRLYIRGSISQIDEEPSDTALTGGFDKNADRGLSEWYVRGTRNLSVVSVDMHLVEYPSRRVVPGASVANSMVVTQRRFEAGAFGVIESGTLGAPLRIERIESRSQAVRNLIEVGAIELLGRHAGVPYWTCLDSPATDAKRNEQDERATRWSAEEARIGEAQDLLTSLGLLSGHTQGELDAPTRRALSLYQSRHHLLPNGTVDYDTLRSLRRSARPETREKETVKAAPLPATSAPAAPKRTTLVAPSTDPDCDADIACDEVYKNLYHFLKTRKDG